MCNRILHNINYCSDSSKYKIFSLHKNSLKLFWIGYLKKKKNAPNVAVKDNFCKIDQVSFK